MPARLLLAYNSYVLIQSGGFVAIVQERKSLMLDFAEYEGITELAKKAGVARPIVVRALLDVSDEAEVIVKARHIKAEKKQESDEAKKKRDALMQLASTLDIDELEALIRKAQGTDEPIADASAV